MSNRSGIGIDIAPNDIFRSAHKIIADSQIIERRNYAIIIRHIGYNCRLNNILLCFTGLLLPATWEMAEIESYYSGKSAKDGNYHQYLYQRETFPVFKQSPRYGDGFFYFFLFLY